MKPTKKVEIKRNEEGAPQLWEDGVNVDTHYVANSDQDYYDKAAYMLFKRYGWSCKSKQADLNICEAIQENYFTINGEDATDYVRCLPASGGVNQILARTGGYITYKKLLEAGFMNHFAAETAYNHYLVMYNPDASEILEILGLKSTER